MQNRLLGQSADKSVSNWDQFYFGLIQIQRMSPSPSAVLTLVKDKIFMLLVCFSHRFQPFSAAAVCL